VKAASIDLFQNRRHLFKCPHFSTKICLLDFLSAFGRNFENDRRSRRLKREMHLISVANVSNDSPPTAVTEGGRHLSSYTLACGRDQKDSKVLTGCLLSNQCRVGAGLDLAELQFALSHSPTRYALFSPDILGPSAGSTAKSRQKEMINLILILIN
jgi:hypothetical protein